MEGLNSKQKLLALAIKQDPQSFIDFLRGEGVVLDNPSLLELNEAVIAPLVAGDDAYEERMQKFFNTDQYEEFDPVTIFLAVKAVVSVSYKAWKDTKGRTADKWAAMMEAYQTEVGREKQIEQSVESAEDELIADAKSQYQAQLEEAQKAQLVTAGYVFGGIAILLTTLYYLNK